MSNNVYPGKEEYLRLAENHDVIPVYRELLADMETPVSVLQRFADMPNCFLLESVEGGETWGRYSFVGVNPDLFLEADHSQASGRTLEALRRIYDNVRVAELEGLPRFFGGAVGFIGYEAISEFERVPAPRKGPEDPGPVSRFLSADSLIVFDNVRHTMKIVVCTRPDREGSAQQAYQRGIEKVSEIVGTIQSPAPERTAQSYPPAHFESNMSREDFARIVNKAKEYIYAGDIIQAVLSQRFSARTDVPAIQLYRALRLLNPSPYMFFFKTGEHVLVGSSPEIMVRLTGSKVELRPIAGTRPRGATPQEDRKLADELLKDDKEKAEHVMLVDLGRNDIGRVAEAGSVQVPEYMVIERYSHVMHLVSHVQGILRKRLDAYDVIGATFPAGTLTGAPKIRAMEIINELEPGTRGAYGGAMGYVGYNGNMDMAITIRTLDISPGSVSVQAGAGIVYDSVPEREFDETCHKARGMQKAVQMAVGGLEVPGGP
ncbi:MAG: anthranilate synthase component I [Kiritimatiellia bacterium]